MVVLQTGALSDGTPVIIRGDIDSAVHLRESVQAVVIHSDVIITAAGADIVVHKPTLPRPMR